MLPALHAASRNLTAGLPNAEDRVAMFEVPAFESVPDMVVTLFDDDHVKRRQAWGGAPVTDPSAVRALVAVNAGVGDLDGIASSVGVSRSHLRRGILPALAESGWTVPLSARDTKVRLLHPYEPLVQWVVTVEAKRTKWREAVAQARRHLRVADRAYVALDAAHLAPAAAVSVELAREGIGLVSVDAVSDSASVVRRPRKGHRPDLVAQSLIGERVWELQVAGVRVGRTSHVFGQTLPTQLRFT